MAAAYLFLVRSMSAMKSYVAAIAMLITLATAHAGSRLVFFGTVTRIESGGIDPLKPFVVTTSVDRVLVGHVSGRRFQFAVHSPSQSGLQVGQRYTVKADHTAGGYVVDELQWRHR